MLMDCAVKVVINITHLIHWKDFERIVEACNLGFLRSGFFYLWMVKYSIGFLIWTNPQGMQYCSLISVHNLEYQTIKLDRVIGSYVMSSYETIIKVKDVYRCWTNEMWTIPKRFTVVSEAVVYTGRKRKICYYHWMYIISQTYAWCDISLSVITNTGYICDGDDQTSQNILLGYLP